jgi:hypothetical protein
MAVGVVVIDPLLNQFLHGLVEHLWVRFPCERIESDAYRVSKSQVLIFHRFNRYERYKRTRT